MVKNDVPTHASTHLHHRFRLLLSAAHQAAEIRSRRQRTGIPVFLILPACLPGAYRHGHDAARCVEDLHQLHTARTLVFERKPVAEGVGAVEEQRLANGIAVYAAVEGFITGKTELKYRTNGTEKICILKH